MQVAKWTYCLLFFLFLVLRTNAQEVSLDQFIQLGLADWVEVRTELPENIRFPWIEEIDLRTETDEFLLSRQEYTFRVAPSSPRLRAAQKSLYQHISNQPNFELQEQLGNKLKNIHEDWLALFMIQKSDALLSQLKQVLEDQNLILSREVAAGNMNVDKTLNLLQDIQEIELTQFKLQREKSSIFSYYKLDSLSIGTIDILSSSDIIQKMNADQLLQNAPTIDKMDFEMETVNRELAVERAERKRLFDFLQVRYRGPHDNFLNERFSVGLALKMDRKNASLLKLKELELEKKSLEVDQVLEANQFSSKRDLLLSEAQKVFEEFQFFLEQMQNEKDKLDQLSMSYANKKGAHPEFLLNVKERELQLELEALGYKEELYNIYLDYLEHIQYFINAPNKAAF